MNCPTYHCDALGGITAFDLCNRLAGMAASRSITDTHRAGRSRVENRNWLIRDEAYSGRSASDLVPNLSHEEANFPGFEHTQNSRHLPKWTYQARFRLFPS